MSKCAVHWRPDHQVLPPASWLKGGLNMETKSRAAPVLSSSYYSTTDTDTLSSLKHRESIQPLLKLTLLNSLYGGYNKAEGPSRLCTKSRNFTSTACFFEPDCVFALCTPFLLFPFASALICRHVFIQTLQNNSNDLQTEPHKWKLQLISTS